MAETVKQLAIGSSTSLSPTTVYTVPANTTTVVRYIRITNLDSVSNTFYLTVAGYRWGYNPEGTTFSGLDGSIGANGYAGHWEGFLVLNAGQTITIDPSGTSPSYHYFLMGVEIS